MYNLAVISTLKKQKQEAPKVQGHPQLTREFLVDLGYIKFHLYNINNSLS